MSAQKGEGWSRGREVARARKALQRSYSSWLALRCSTLPACSPTARLPQVHPPPLCCRQHRKVLRPYSLALYHSMLPATSRLLCPLLTPAKPILSSRVLSHPVLPARRCTVGGREGVRRRPRPEPFTHSPPAPPRPAPPRPAPPRPARPSFDMRSCWCLCFDHATAWRNFEAGMPSRSCYLVTPDVTPLCVTSRHGVLVLSAMVACA